MAGALQALIGSLAGVIKDAYFKYVTLLLPGNGTNGAQNNTFLDASTNNFTITRNGNTTQGTFTPYGANWSNYFNNESANNSYLSVASNAAFAYGTGDFTAECWVYLTATPTADAGIIEQRPASTNGSYLLIGVNSSKQLFVYVNTAYRIGPSVSTAVSANTWNHVAYSRSSGTATLYLNGSSIGSWSDSTTYGNQPVGIGYQAFTPSNVYFPGYISNLRIVKGTAVYASAFTPSTTPLTAISGTSLLTCQSNRFIDNSSNAFAITVTGTPSVQRFSPFSPSDAYSTSTTGGSGYFDGTGDYLTTTYSTTAFDWWTSDFTVEAWIYPTTFTGWYYNYTGADHPVLIGNNDPASLTNYWTFGPASSTGQVRLYYYNGAATYGTLSTETVKLNQWNHIALTKTSSGYVYWVNGIGSSTFAISGTPQSSSSVSLTIGAGNNTYINGYVSNARIVKGTAVYTSNFTPPTAPLTAITNTSLLLLGTNAGVFDNAMMNDLETVGNAQISTTQSKFGGSSMYFDGGATSYLVSNSASSLYAFGTGDFTIEMWLYYTGTAAFRTIIDFRTTSPQVVPWLYFDGSNQINYNVNGTVYITTSAISTSTWVHVALCRSSGVSKIYVNGTQSGSGPADTNNMVSNTARPIIGTNGTSLGSQMYQGYIDDLRITKGYARYTANFTPPTAAFPTS